MIYHYWQATGLWWSWLRALEPSFIFWMKVGITRPLNGLLIQSDCLSTGAPVILAYLNEKNRPYSAQDVFTNLQKQHGLGKTVRLSENVAHILSHSSLSLRCCRHTLHSWDVAGSCQSHGAAGVGRQDQGENLRQAKDLFCRSSTVFFSYIICTLQIYVWHQSGVWGASSSF